MSRVSRHTGQEGRPARPSWCRCLGVWVGVSLLCGTAGALCLETALAQWELVGAQVGTQVGAQGSFEELVVLAGGLAGSLSLGWLWAVATATLLGAARGRFGPGARAVGVRRLVLTLCGIALTAGVAAPSHAARGPSGSLDGLPHPDRPSIGADRDSLPAAARSLTAAAGSAAPVRTHVVLAGDTLWSIAAGTLPAAASPLDTDARWREIHRLNRAAIGADPDLIRPGQVLTLPITHEGDQS